MTTLATAAPGDSAEPVTMSSSAPLTVIEPGRADRNYWRDLWRFRELFLVLAWRDVTVRYKQTVIGVVWALLRPALTIVILTIIFGTIAKLPTEAGAPYALLVCAGTLPWTFFSAALMDASGSLIGNARLISKVYFPRLIVPASAAVVAFVDFLIGFLVLGAVMALYGFVPGPRVLLLPIFIVLMFGAALGPALWLSAVNVKYRDFRYVIPFVAQFGLYISPVGFSSAIIPEQWRLLYSLNPMVSVIDGFRWSLLGGEMYWPGFAVGCAVVSLLAWFGVRKFRRLEKSFADLI